MIISSEVCIHRSLHHMGVLYGILAFEDGIVPGEKQWMHGRNAEHIYMVSEMMRLEVCEFDRNSGR